MQQEIFERMCAKQVECTKQIIEVSQEVLRALRILKYNGKVINKRLEKLLPKSQGFSIALHYTSGEPVIWVYNHNRSYPDRLQPDKFGHTTCSYISYSEQDFPLGFTRDDNGNLRLDINETAILFTIVQVNLEQRIEAYSSAPADRLKAVEEFGQICKQINEWKNKYNYIARDRHNFIIERY